jgi:shikimate kinase
MTLKYKYDDADREIGEFDRDEWASIQTAELGHQLANAGKWARALALTGFFCGMIIGAVLALVVDRL